MMKNKLPLKVHLSALFDYANYSTMRFIKYWRKSFSSIITDPSQIIPKIIVMCEQLDDQIEMKDSVPFRGYEELIINTLKYSPLRGRQCFELPSILNNKKALINIKNKDTKCFLYCLIASQLKIVCHPERVRHYENSNIIKIPEGSTFPPQYEDFEKYEDLNNLMINVF